MQRETEEVEENLNLSRPGKQSQSAQVSCSNRSTCCVLVSSRRREGVSESEPGKMNGDGEFGGGDSVAEAEAEAGRGGVTLEDLKKKMAEFARERNWDKFHSPRNLLLALVGEVGELSEIFQWKGEVPKGLPDWNAADKEHLGEELSDVLLYLVRLADTCGVDLGEAALRKVKKNEMKYPVERCKGSSKKYTHYTNCNGVNGEELRADNL